MMTLNEISGFRNKINELMLNANISMTWNKRENFRILLYLNVNI